MDEAFLFDKPQVLASGVDAFESKMLADLQEGGDDPFAALVLLKEGVDLRLAWSEPIRHGGRILYKVTVFEEKLFPGGGSQSRTGRTRSDWSDNEKPSQSDDCERAEQR